ncbi:MAG: hypothetical protein ACTSQI_21770, partial [Candidatus Helarchaeota archaeon]
MNPNHVVNLELSKKLKEVGYPQEGEFWWNYNPNLIKLSKELKIKGIIYAEKYVLQGALITGEGFVAPLASELMERLPSNITIQQPRKGYWYILFRDKLRAKDNKIYNDRYNTEADI